MASKKNKNSTPTQDAGDNTAAATEVETQPAAEQEVTEPQQVTTYDELVDAARTKDAKLAGQGVKESDETYLKRLISVLADLDDDTFNSLPQDAQDWYNAAGEALNEGKPLSSPAGFVSKFGVKAAPAAKDPKAPKAPPPPRPPGKTLAVRKLVCANPSITLDALEAELKALKLDIVKATISTIRSDVLATISAAKEVGRWKD